MHYLFTLSALAGWSLIFNQRFGQRFSVLGTVLFLMTAFFFSAVVGQFATLSSAIAWTGALYVPLRLFYHRKNQAELKQIALNTLPWLIIFSIAYLCSRGSVNWAWDEFTHWGTHVEYLRLFGELKGDPTLLIFADYIPGMSLWRAFFRNHIASLGTAGAYFADWVLILACFHTLSAGKKTPQKLALWGMLLGIWIIFFQSLILTLYVDQIQGILFLTGLALVSLEAPQALLLLLIAALTSTKHVGLLFSLGIACYYGCHRVFVKQAPLRKSVQQTILLATCAIAIWGIWAIFVKTSGIAASLDAELPTGLGQGPGDFLVAAIKTLGDVLHGEYPHAWYLKHTWTTGFSFPAYVLLALCFSSIFLAGLKNTGSVLHDRLDFAFAVAFVSLYTVFLAVVWSRIPQGADTFSYTRYLAVPLMGVTAHFYWRKSAFQSPGPLLIASLAVIIPCALMLAPPIAALIGNQKPGLAAQQKNQRVLAGVRQHTAPQDSIWYLVEPEHIRDYFVFRALILPQHLADWHPLVDLTLKRGQPGWLEPEPRQALLAEKLCDARYVYTAQLSDAFWEDYRTYFDVQKNESLYQTKKSESGGCTAHWLWSVN